MDASEMDRNKWGQFSETPFMQPFSIGIIGKQVKQCWIELVLDWSPFRQWC
ncbi:hypothetical protein [Cardinium endosymbiont of Nabis limbatus]|uniref:hypothetical protein n=1 Tax=Cardinium endosymbiont of Nabis limbatus TaxID=3066217 RepID=UPI003AF399D9